MQSRCAIWGSSLQQSAAFSFMKSLSIDIPRSAISIATAGSSLLSHIHFLQWPRPCISVRRAFVISLFAIFLAFSTIRKISFAGIPVSCASWIISSVGVLCSSSALFSRVIHIICVTMFASRFACWLFPFATISVSVVIAAFTVLRISFSLSLNSASMFCRSFVSCMFFNLVSYSSISLMYADSTLRIYLFHCFVWPSHSDCTSGVGTTT